MVAPTREWLPRQWRFLRSEDPARALFGGNGCGKTEAGAGFGLDQALTYPGSLGAIVAPTFPQLIRSTMLKTHAFLRSQGYREGVHWNHHKTERKVTLSNGSAWFYVSCHVTTKELEGPEFDWLLIDEVAGIEEEKFGVLNARVRSPMGSRFIRVVGWPPPVGHWAHRIFVTHAEPGHSYEAMPTHDNLQCNGGFLPDSYIDRLETMFKPGTPIHKRKVMGQFAQMDGAVYPEFDPDVHLCDPADAPEPRAFAYGLDFGYVNPFVFLRAYICDRGHLWIDAEHYQSGWRIGQHDEAMRPMYHEGSAIFADHAVQEREELGELAYLCIPAQKSINLGIDCVRERLVSQTIHFLRGRCPNTLDEFSKYVWSTATNTKGEQLPVKKNDHAMDALRYLVTGIDAPDELTQRRVMAVEAAPVGGLY